uniref:GAG-pre-integrase domain-containing protein n=1 Tax=Tanacetum cinerariifolium TaxID=118510 RepID=A0A699KD49_TANCI|nr:hypothetical protein [Tanacetum cinerariifolium]
MCVLHSLNGVNSRTKMPMAVPISTREPKRTVNQSVAKPLRRTVASESTNQIPRHTTRKLYEHVTKTCSWWYPKFTPPEYKWKPKSKIGNVNPNLVKIILFIIDSGRSKHMTGNLKLLINFVEKFLGLVKFGNDQIAPILGYGDLGNDILIGSRGTDLYSITLQDTSSPNPICLMAKATSSQAWLWHRRLSHLNFDTINLLSKNDIVIGLPKPKDETPEVLIDFLRLVQRGLHAQVRIVRTDKGTEFLNKTLHAYFASEGINHQTFVARTLNKTALSKDETVHSLRLLEQWVFNKRTRVIVETIHVNFDELPQMASDHVSSDPVPQSGTVTISNELDLLFSLMFDELLNGSTQFVSKSSAVTTADTPNQCQQQNTTTLNNQTTPEPTCQVLTQAPTVTSTENINQAETITENTQVEDDGFINIFCTSVQDRGETSSRHVDSSNMHSFYQ